MSELIVPEGWKLKTIEDICETITSGGTPSRSDSSYFNGDIPWVKMTDLKNDLILDTKERLTKKGIKNSSAKIFPKNTVLIAMYTFDMGKTAILGVDAATNQAICGLQCKNDVLPKFLLYFIKSHQNQIKKLGSGGAQPNINQSKVKSLCIPMPPLETQKKIVQKLDHILGQLEEKKKTLSEIANKNENRINLIYEQIDGEIITKYFESQEVRENSVYHTFEDVCILNPPKSELTNFNENMEVSFVPMITVDDVEGVIKTPEIRRLKEVKKGYTYFRENDVIFAKITPCMENGKSAIGKNLKNKIGFGSTEFHVLRPKDMVLSEWIYYFVRQNKFRKHAELVMSGSAGQQRVPISFIKSYEIPIPDIRIQKKIIEEIKNSRKSVLQIQDNIQPLFNRLKNSNEYLNQLNNSILDKAFSGKLVN